MGISKVNVKENFKKFHDLDVDILDGVAIILIQIILKKVTVYYQNIFSSQ